MSDKAIKSTTQEFLDVYDIVNDMVLLKDGTVSIILQIGTMNFSLLAEEEQDAVIFTYGSLLNSLNYPIQINIQSQTKDATKYLRLLDEQIAKTNSGQKAILIRQYRDFVAALIKERNVLQKRFYVVVPASPGEMGLITPSNVLPGKTNFDINAVEKSVLVEKALNLLEPRRDHLISQFNRLGLYARQLNTQEIIQNFYINYNPEAVEGQEVGDSENYTTPLVRASFGGQFMQSNNQINDQLINNAENVNNLAQAQAASPEPIVQNQAPINQNQVLTNQNQAPINQNQVLTNQNQVSTDPATAPTQEPILTTQEPTPEEILSNRPLEEIFADSSTASANPTSAASATPPDFIAQTVDDVQSDLEEGQPTTKEPQLSAEEPTSTEEAQFNTENTQPNIEEIQPINAETQPSAEAETPDATLINNVAANTNSTSEAPPMVAPTPSGNLDQAATDQAATEQARVEDDGAEQAIPEQFSQQPSSEINLNLDPNLIKAAVSSQTPNKTANEVVYKTPNEAPNETTDVPPVFTEDITPLQNKFENETKIDQTQKQTQTQEQTIKSEA